ncbi:signal peptide protein [Streptomyces sp. DH10]|uniref:signal peptide protein n=1 Tax=Streptomyces sp. DH10 TaxID=3040121 RepID=UPI00244333B9|nr:signal peptide protein [Streptomyces sp. DH10]MDG9712272.1 signal peptide protein [Streptomyces sp. DH10]
MSSKNSRIRVALLAAVVAVTGLAAAGPALAATPAGTPAVTVTSSQAQDPAIPTDFVNLPTSPLRADAPQEFTVTYRNTTSAPTTVAPQLLVTSLDTGPFLAPSDIKVERRTGHGCWVAVPLGSQTGTLFTDLVGAERALGAGETLAERYRVTVLRPEAGGTVEPRVALYG